MSLRSCAPPVGQIQGAPLWSRPPPHRRVQSAPTRYLRVAPLRPRRVRRAERRSTSLEASAPHRIMSGTRAAASDAGIARSEPTAMA